MVCATDPFAALGYFAFDFGPARRVRVREYSLMHGAPAGMHRLTDWVLEASPDAVKDADAARSWRILSEHVECADLANARYATASWAIPEEAHSWARSLRVRQTMPHATGSRALYVGAVEFYGDLLVEEL